MTSLFLLDVAPDPVSLGIIALVILFVIGFIVLLLGSLVFFLWYRKRSMKHTEVIRSETQPSNTNHP